jgi:hypothetical protein
MTLVTENIETEGLSCFYQKIQDNSTNTPIAIVSTYYPITGTRVNSELVNFTAQASTLTYTGAKTRRFRISGSFSWEAGSTLSDVYKMALVKNGTTVIGEIRALLDNALPYPRNSSIDGIVELAQNDTIECMVTNEEGTQDVLIIDMLLVGGSIN